MKVIKWRSSVWNFAPVKKCGQKSRTFEVKHDGPWTNVNETDACMRTFCEGLSTEFHENMKKV